MGRKATPDEYPQEPEQETDTSVEAVQLSVNDLQALGAVVDLASRRGAFQASEMEQVGKVYNKLVAFLDYVKSQQEPVEDEQEVKKTAVTEE